MKRNPTYDKHFEQVQQTIKSENKKVCPTYMGQGVPGLSTPGITMAQYLDEPEKGPQRFVDYINRLNERGEISCMNGTYPAYNDVTLASVWWSHIKMPGHELPENSIWQVEEKRNMEDSDYDLILEKGVAAFTQQLFPKIIDMSKMPKLQAYMAKMPEYVQLYADSGYVLLNSGAVCPPFETLCGGRGINDFFMDCYKRIDKVKAVQDVLMEGIRANVAAMPVTDYTVGSWVGGWRGASAMVNQKIWDTLVWPYMKEAAEMLIAKGITPIMHIDSSWDRDIERFKELPAQKIIINTDNATDLREARKKLGNHAAFLGDVPVQMLAVSEPEDVKEYCRRLVGDIGAQGLFLAPGCDAPANAKFENMAAIYEVAQEL